MKRNLATSLRRCRSRDPMAAYDRAPVPLRHWLAAAALPWSVKSAVRLYHRALRARHGDVSAALEVLSQRERAMLARDRFLYPVHENAGAGELRSRQHS